MMVFQPIADLKVDTVSKSSLKQEKRALKGPKPEPHLFPKAVRMIQETAPDFPESNLSCKTHKT